MMPDNILDAALEQVFQSIGHWKRSAWQPIVSEGDGDLESSKFGGKPWIGSNEERPICPNFGTPMRFFL